MSKNRKIKLQPKTRTLSYGHQKIVPELRINGNWLLEHGFHVGEHVEILASENQLIIKPVA